jgi:two-component system nitrate/nitrite response regulator NarL
VLKYFCDEWYLCKKGAVTPLTKIDLRVLIVADDPLARTGLAALLADQPEVTITGQVPVDANLFEALAVYLPDVLLWDMGSDPVLVLERLGDLEEVGLPVVALVPDEAQAVDVWVAGANGLLLREASADRLVTALVAVSQGLTVLDQGIAGAVRPSRDLTPTPLADELTPRELEVLQLMAEGLSNKAIAYQLDISEHTVKFHVNAILGKLGAQSRTEAVVRATRLGLIIL